MSEGKRGEGNPGRPVAEGAASPSGDEAAMRALVRGVMQVSGALCGAYYELVAPDRLRSSVVEGVFPLLALDGRGARRDGESRASWIGRIFRGEDLAVSDSWLGAVVRSGQPELVRDATRDSRLPRPGDEPLAISSLLAVLVIRENRIGGVVVVANPVQGGAFRSEAATAVVQWLSSAVAGATDGAS